MNTLLIAGSREIPDDYTTEDIEHMLSNASYIFDTVFGRIISGGAKGVDTLAEQWATSRGYEFVEYPADWNRYGRSAGYRRNAEMVFAATHGIVIWDGESKGTKHTIDLLHDSGKPHVLIVL